MKQKKWNGIGSKLFFIGVIFCILLVGLFCIQGQRKSREHTYEDAKYTIERSAGGAMRMDGPYLEIPVVHTWYVERTVDNKTVRDKNVELVYETVRASSLLMQGELESQMRSVGIYSAPIYTGTLNLDATFDIDFENADGYEYQLDKAMLYINADKKNLTKHPVFDVNGFSQSADLKESHEYGSIGDCIGVPCVIKKGKNTFSTSVNFRGADKFIVVPAAKETSVTVNADWPSPGFAGFDYLPDTHAITANGFTASWNIPFANTSSKIGFRYVQTVDLYKQLNRACTYGFLFILVPFLVLFLSELFAHIHLHPMHYLLSGAACIIFFLLLLSFSEHISFFASYLLAASAASLLVSSYLASFTKRIRSGIIMSGVFVLLYAYLYFSLKSEDYAFLIGSLFAFIILAAVMFFTRKVDWNAFHVSKIQSEEEQNGTDLTDPRNVISSGNLKIPTQPEI